MCWYFKTLGDCVTVWCGDWVALWCLPSRTWKGKCRRQWPKRCLIISVTPPPLSSYWQWLLLPLWMLPTEMRWARVTLLSPGTFDYFVFWTILFVLVFRCLKKGPPTLRTTPISLAPRQRRLLLWALPTKAQWRESRLPSSQQET